MPAVNFFIRWPSGEEEQCYSPSTVIHDYFKEGDSMPLGEFLVQVEKALKHASDRVVDSYGYACSSASDQLSKLQQKSGEFNNSSGKVMVLSMTNITG